MRLLVRLLKSQVKTKIDHSKTRNIYKGIMSFIIEFM